MVGLISPPLKLHPDLDYRLSLIAGVTDEVTVSAVWARTRKEAPIVIPDVIRVSHSAGDRTREVFTNSVGGGYLYRMGTGTPGGVKRGDMYGEIGLGWRGGGGFSISAGYISESMGLKPGFFEPPTQGPGKIVSNDGATTLVNNTAITRTITVPPNARWRWHGGAVFNADDVARNVKVRADTGGANLDVARLHRQDVAAGARIAYPNTFADDEVGSPMEGIPLLESWRILITWEAGGASAGGAARSSALVEELIEL